MFDIQNELKKLPEQPGVYIMRDELGEIIYIGKAINLKNRVTQYFHHSKNHTPKVIAMVSRIKEFEYIITDSELEALILECNLIKKHRPKYNILLKDDKHYPYIKVTMNEEFPRILIVRRIDSDGAKYFGPYTSMFYVRESIETIKSIFPIRTCQKVLPRDVGKGRACLNFHIKKCLAPCQGGINKQEYRNMMENVCMFLGGKHGELIEDLEQKMAKYSQNLEFEEAAKLRDKINSIKHIAERQKIISSAMQDQDVIAFAGDKEAVVQVFFIRGGKLLGREKFVLDGTESTSKKQVLHEFITQFYTMTEYVPREILLQEEIDEVNIIESWLSSKRGSKVYIRVPKKGEKHELIDLVYKNAVDALKSFEEKNKRKQEILAKLKELLELDKIPKRIEAYDISNIGGSLSVGCMVTFTDGEPDKSLYRKFKIKSMTGQNDYGSIQEVLFRRINNKAKFPELPDLILIDGGKGHVNSAEQVLHENGINVPICGMVKDNKHKTRGLIFNNKEYNFEKNIELFNFISIIQDEVHRFAITFHKSLREKQIEKSMLDEIKGIGQKRKIELIKHFKTVDNIKKASADELSKVEGMNRTIAQKIFEYFNG